MAKAISEHSHVRLALFTILVIGLLALGIVASGIDPGPLGAAGLLAALATLAGALAAIIGGHGDPE